MTLVATVGQAGTSWTSYSIALDTSANWRVGDLSGAAATQAQIQDVLGHLTQMLIRAEFVDGGESGGLDNVIMATSGSVTAKTWLDANDNWATGADWSGGTVPTASDNVIIGQGSPQITAPISAHSVTITGAGSGLAVAANIHYAGVFSAAAGMAGGPFRRRLDPDRQGDPGRHHSQRIGKGSTPRRRLRYPN